MKINTTIFIFGMALLALNVSAQAQTEIKKGLFAFGDYTGSIKGKTVIKLDNGNFDIEIDMIEALRKNAIDAYSIDAIVLPGSNLSDDAYAEALKNKGVQTILWCEITDWYYYETLNKAAEIRIYHADDNYTNPVAMFKNSGEYVRKNQGGRLTIYASMLVDILKNQ